MGKIDFSKMTAVSAASGFEYYATQTFAFTTPPQTIPIVSGGVYHDYGNSASISRNLSGIAPTQKIMTNIQYNVDANDAPGSFRTGPSVTGQNIIGSSGGFPIFYQYNVTAQNDAANLTFTIRVGNPSAVNAVTPPAIVVSGKVFFYLAPF